ncbi:ABC-type antimicrobial peptide transport system, permease component [Micromonospora coriariae]|uniref:ABC-type antimicrobial peptide transport system, permease component n=1 Tax=Micromonospora coriariae TaxID=285665 RepID=A0A1C4UPK6_9ACTN|nr:ABC transporter permease [Micromonospora coriariae]SCE73636.1 ABC-type antimicrobial peptide transport system, permease component [Micromonospora coriariae]
MKLVWRRAREARGLLVAAVIAALVAVALVTGLSDYNRRAVDAGQRALVAASPAEERGLLVSGSGGRDAAEFATRDKAVRAGFADGFAGVPVTVGAARYGTGRELTGDLGSVPRTDDEPIFANVATFDDLARHAELTSGAWPQPGANPIQVSLPERVAGQLGLRVGERVPARDRSAERRSEFVVAGIWRPRDPIDTYWLLAPGVGADSVGSTTSYGPFALDPADFAATFRGSVSASWLAEPDLGGVDTADLPAMRNALTEATTTVPEAAQLGSSGQAVTKMERLLDRIARADLVGRSSLATPLLLILVLGGYALVLVAALLHEDRRPQTALLRARGAARRQLAGLAAREATLVVAPAAVLGPLIASEALRYIRPGGSAELSTAGGNTTLVWAAAAATAAGCLVAMVLPALRSAGTYVADMAARSRPNRAASVQRASVDLVLVALAVLAWVQLRRYASPLAGSGGRLGLDPLLIAAPTLGVLAGAVLALRVLPPLTRFAERFVDRRPWTATMFGMWQAGRRPHAGPVLLLALAVGGSTLAWSLISTGERSQVEQASHTVGADLRVTERTGSAPPSRAGQLVALPGVDRVLPAWRDETRVGREDLPVTVIGVDPASAPGVVRLADRLSDEPVSDQYNRMVGARGKPVGVELPADVRAITGTVRTPVVRALQPLRVAVTLLVTSSDGLALRLPVADSDSAGRATRFTVRLPDVGAARLRLAGFEADGGRAAGSSYGLQVDGLTAVAADGTTQPVELTGDWAMMVPGKGPSPVVATGSGFAAVNPVAVIPGGEFAYQPYTRFAVVPAGDSTPVPVLMTPRVRDALSLNVGDTVDLTLSGATLRVHLVGELTAVPATTGEGILLDLPAAVDTLILESGAVRPVPEWWVGADDPMAAARAASELPDVTVLNREAVIESAADDPYWRGSRTGMLAAALGAVLLALVGLMVDVWATARRRLGEFAVLHTLGATPRLLARALLAEQTFLAGIGVGVGLLLGAAVGATMAPLVILTPAAGRPVPPATFALPWVPIGVTAVGLLLAALAFSAFIATGIRQRVAAVQLRIGGER